MEFLRKFGSKYSDLSTMIKNITFLLQILLVNIDRKFTNRISTICYVFTIFAGFSYFYVYMVSMLWFVLIRYQHTGDLVAACVVFSLAACSFSGIVKLIYIRFYNDKVMNLVEEYLACDALIKPGSRYSINLLKALKYVKQRAIFFWLYQIINGSLYIIIPLFLPGRHVPEDLFVLYGLEPTFDTPNYQLVYTLMAGGVLFAITTETNTAVFIAILAGYIEAYLLALSEELNNLWEDAKGKTQDILEETNELAKYKITNNDKVINVNIRNLLRDIVNKHKMSINLLSQLENMFKGTMTVEFGLATSGLIAELLGGLESTYMQLPYTLLQVTMDCYVGQRLIDASLVLEKAVYCSKWERFDSSNQKTVYLMLLISQKTLKLSVGGLTFLSFSCLMTVLKSIYSAYTTLHSRI